MEVVADGDTNKITYSGQWSTVNTSGATDGTVHSSSDPSASITLVFLGTFIQIDALKSPNGGNFTVLLDGSLFGPYSLYSPNATISNVWSQTSLSPSATHTVELRKVQANTSLDDVHSINVDSFRVAAVATPSPTSTSSQSTSTSTSSTSRSSTSSLTNERPISTPSSSPVSTLSSLSPSSTTQDVPVPSFSTSTFISSSTFTPLTPSSSSFVPEPESPPSYIDTDSEQPSVVVVPAPVPVPEPSDTSNTFADPGDDSSSPDTGSTSSTTSRSSTSRTTSSSSTSSRSHTTFVFTPPLSTTTHSGTSAAATETQASSGSNQNKVGVIIGSISAFVIITSLLVILVVAVRRRLAKRTEESLRPRTTPAYQTTSTQRMTGAPLAPLGVYNRYPSPNSTSSHGVSQGLYNTTAYGFGSNSHQALSPVARTISSPNNVGAGGGSAEDRPISSVEESSSNAHYVFQPTSAVDDSRRPEYAESVASDYPYTLTFQSPRAY